MGTKKENIIQKGEKERVKNIEKKKKEKKRKMAPPSSRHEARFVASHVAGTRLCGQQTPGGTNKQIIAVHSIDKTEPNRAI